MRLKHLAGLAAALHAGRVAAGRGIAKELIVYHGWSTPSEVAALHIFQDALTAKGHSWKDLAIPHNSGVNVSLVNLVTGGNPPNAVRQLRPGRVPRPRQARARARPDRLLQRRSARPITSSRSSSELSTVDGKMVKIPLFMHIDGMVYWNMEVAKKAGVDPTAWKIVDDMIADFPKIKAAGFIAAGGGRAGLPGRLPVPRHARGDRRPRHLQPHVWRRARPHGVRHARGAQGASTIIRVFSKQAPPEAENRPWNETTHTVIAGKALSRSWATG